MPKPLIEIYDRPFFYWSVMSIRRFLPDCDITFVVLKEHVEEFDIAEKIRKFFPDARICVIDHVLPGAVMTCMEGAKSITDDAPVLFNDCDHLFRCDALTRYVNEEQDKYDGLLLTFTSDSPAFSYVACDENGVVTRTVEKQVISSDAICGAYYFKNKDVFLKNAEAYLEKCEYSEYFMSGVYNIMAEKGLLSGVARTDFHVSFGTPKEYEIAETRQEYKELL